MWDDGRLVLFDRDGRLRQQIPHQFLEDMRVLDAALSPDLTWAVTVGQQGSVQLWDVDAQGYWKWDDILAGHTGDVEDVAIGIDGRLLTVAPNEEEAILWQARGAGSVGPWTGEELLRRACGVVGASDISTLDWQRHLPGRPWRPTCSDLV
jgi:WD40 repeat protein